jgi:hypothetical protein
MAPPNIRELVGDIREALDRFPREALIEILTYVFKEYVVEGPAPIQGAPAPLRDDLEGMGFAEVIRSLQLRLDLPELALFEVQGERVTVKIGGRPMPIETQTARPEPLPAAPPPSPPAAPPSAPPGLTSVAVAVPAAAAPRQGAPAGAPGTTREEVPLVGPRAQPQPQAAAPAAAPAAPTPPAAPAGKPAAAPSTAQADDAVDKTGRFGLLEID